MGKFMEKLGDTRDEWAQAVGRVLLAFGGIEHVTVICLQQVTKYSDAKPLAELSFVSKVKILLKDLRSRPGVAFSALIEQLQDARELAKKRNLIVHNPLVLQVYEKEGGYACQEVISALHKSEVVTLEDLGELVDKMEKLAADLYRAITSDDFPAPMRV